MQSLSKKILTQLTLLKEGKDAGKLVFSADPVTLNALIDDLDDIVHDDSSIGIYYNGHSYTITIKYNEYFTGAYSRLRNLDIYVSPDVMIDYIDL